MSQAPSPAALRIASFLAAALLFAPAAHALSPACAMPRTNPTSALASSLQTPGPGSQLIVIGFMGGRVHPTNLAHREAQVAAHLEKLYPRSIHADTFANHNADAAFRHILDLLDRDHDGCLSPAEKNSARIVIFGHSWGASETVALARRLNDLSIPVLLTVQVDSVQKPSENDAVIPPNVKKAINFFETEGLLHGRAAIAAMDPQHTTILGNFQSSYKSTPVALNGYPWFARTFMKPHIEIENDPSVWNRVEALIGQQLN